MRTKLLVLGCVLTLAGCAAGPDYIRPDVAAASRFQGDGRIANRHVDTPAPALDTWWKGFDDPELVTIIERVSTQNLDLAASAARVQQARAVARHASADRLPEGSLSADVTRQRQSLESPLGKIASAFPGYDRKQTLEDVGVGASWEADLAGGLRRGSEAADAEYQAAEANHVGVRISLAAEAADAYFRVRGAQARVAIAEEQIKNEAGLVDLVKLRGAGGVGTLRETAQAQALLLQARATVPPLRREIATQLNRLDVLMGAAPGTYAAEIVQGPRAFAVPSIATAGGPSELLRRRPDVIAAERRVAASNARIGQALAGYYPSISLSSVLGFSALGSGSLLTSDGFQPAAMLGLHWRLFDFGRVDAEVQQARGANAEALAAYRQSMLRATEDVENALVAVAELEQQHQLLGDEVAAHVQARDAAQDAYKGGAVSLIEVLDEDRQLLASRDLLAQVHADDARSAVAAFRALGGGWHAPGTMTAGR
jgi:NodT family efflux transporter outer membrane factor (OMF) lipoprotein